MAFTTTRHLLLATTVTVVLAAACAWPAWAWQGSEGLAALGIAAVVCLAGAVAGRLLGMLVRSTDASPRGAVTATQAGMAARLVVTLLLSLPVLLGRPFDVKPFVVWLGVQYLAQLALEVFVSLRELGQNRGPTGTPARMSQPEAELPSGSTARRVADAEGAERR